MHNGCSSQFSISLIRIVVSRAFSFENHNFKQEDGLMLGPRKGMAWGRFDQVGILTLHD
mgnify:CR=1 FL=1